MSSAHRASATANPPRRIVRRLSRRSVLLGAATVGVGSAVVSVTSLSEAFDDTRSASGADAIVVHVRDVKAGRLDVFAGDRRIEIRDRGLAARLANAARAS